MTGGALQDEAPGALSVYDPTPEQRRAASLYVCTRFTATDARPVLECLGLIDPIDTAAPAARDSLGRLAR